MSNNILLCNKRAYHRGISYLPVQGRDFNWDYYGIVSQKKFNFSLLLVANVSGADAEKETLVSMMDYVLFVDRLMPQFSDA